MWGRLLFGIIAAIVLGGAILFVYRRTVADTVKSLWVRRTMAALLVALFLAVPVSRFIYGKELPPAWATTAVLTGWGVCLYTLIALLTVEGPQWLVVAAKWIERRGRKSLFPPAPPLRAPENPARRLFLSRAAASGALAVGCGAGSFGTWRAFAAPEITRSPSSWWASRGSGGFISCSSATHIGYHQTKFVDRLVDIANSAKGTWSPS